MVLFRSRSELLSRVGDAITGVEGRVSSLEETRDGDSGGDIGVATYRGGTGLTAIGNGTMKFVPLLDDDSE